MSRCLGNLTNDPSKVLGLARQPDDPLLVVSQLLRSRLQQHQYARVLQQVHADQNPLLRLAPHHQRNVALGDAAAAVVEDGRLLHRSVYVRTREDHWWRLRDPKLCLYRGDGERERGGACGCRDFESCRVCDGDLGLICWATDVWALKMTFFVIFLHEQLPFLSFSILFASWG